MLKVRTQSFMLIVNKLVCSQKEWEYLLQELNSPGKVQGILKEQSKAPNRGCRWFNYPDQRHLPLLA